MILNRWQLVVTPTPHLHPLPFSKGRGNSSRWQVGRLPYNFSKGKFRPAGRRGASLQPDKIRN